MTLALLLAQRCALPQFPQGEHTSFVPWTEESPKPILQFLFSTLPMGIPIQKGACNADIDLYSGELLKHRVVEHFMQVLEVPRRGKALHLRRFPVVQCRYELVRIIDAEW